MEEKKIFEEFKMKRKKQLIAAGVLIAVMIYIIIAGEKPELRSPGIPEKYLVYGIIGIFVAVTGFSFKNWRCPVCNKYLGRGINPESCKSCGVKLR